MGGRGSSSRDCCLCVCLMSLLVFFFEASHWPSDCGRINQAADRWQDQPGSRPLAGSTRQQTAGRINQAPDRLQDQPGTDCGDGDEDEDEDEDEIQTMRCY